EASKANQKVIRNWYEFYDEFDKQVNQKSRSHKISKKQAMSKIYNQFLKWFPNMTQITLRKRVEKETRFIPYLKILVLTELK
ncbi:9350_t:CDS:1, partial [Racocetra persica]